MIASTTSWTFFLLINGFYGGALTMFFANEITIPFNSVEDAMRAYPSWKLKMMSGSDIYFQYKALQVSSTYAISTKILTEFLIIMYFISREIHYILNFGIVSKIILKKPFIIQLKRD